MHVGFPLALLIMKLLCIALLVAGANCFYIDNAGGKTKEKIVGGEYSLVTRAPYQAQIVQLGTPICGATIVSEYWLVSAAHCFEEPYGMSIVTGATYRSGDGEKHEIEKVIIHRNYDVFTNDNDISLIKLKKPIKFSDKQKAIPLATSPPKTGDTLKISGFGLEGDNRRASPILKIATVPVVDHRICALKYIRDPITSNMFCAGIGAMDACQGDSGGPGVIKGKLAGVVSSGMDCGSRYYPGIYTRIDKYHKWITGYTKTR